MNFFFTERQIEKISSLNPFVTTNHKKYEDTSELARQVIARINPEEFKVTNNEIVICADDRISSYSFYNGEKCRVAEEDIKEEIMQIFGLEAEVIFKFVEAKDEEPDPIPPLYWGETERVYYYSLTIKIEL